MGALDPDKEVGPSLGSAGPGRTLLSARWCTACLMNPKPSFGRRQWRASDPPAECPVSGSIVGDRGSGLLWLDPLIGVLGGCSYAESHPIGPRVVDREARSPWHHRQVDRLPTTRGRMRHRV